MAFSPIDADPAALRVAEYYANAELELIQKMVDMLKVGVDLPDWDTARLGVLQELRAMAIRTLGATDVAGKITEEVAAAYAGGEASALSDMSSAVSPTDALRSDTARAQVSALAASATGAVESATPILLRAVDDVYRQVVGDVVAQTLLGTTTRREAMQRAVNQFLGNGLPSFRSSDGRNYRIQDYVRMAVRTATAKSAIAGHLDTASANGFELCIIQPGPRACKVCDKWAGKVLHRSGGSAGDITLRNEVTGKTIVVHVDGSLDEARSAGWGHPNCRCNIRVFIPGATHVVSRPPWDQAGYEAQQHQRQIENQIRQAKLKQAVAITPEAEAKARMAVRANQLRMRQHIEANPFLKRQSANEQV